MTSTMKVSTSEQLRGARRWMLSVTATVASLAAKVTMLYSNGQN